MNQAGHASAGVRKLRAEALKPLPDHRLLGGGIVERQQVGGAQQPLDLVAVLCQSARQLRLSLRLIACIDAVAGKSDQTGQKGQDQRRRGGILARPPAQPIPEADPGGDDTLRI
jgi:hypothetical protein